MVLAGPGIFLIFDYSFIEGALSDDEFGAFILDSSGVSAGVPFEFFTQTTSAGTVSFNLSTLTGEPFIGLQFQLLSLPGDTDLDSIVTVSNVRLENKSVIPEPSTALLLAVALIGIMIGEFRIRRTSYSVVERG